MSATVAVDTVPFAEQDPERSQPFRELGLAPGEYAKIREILGRRPTASELMMYSIMWSEHCSYKSSKVHLKKFGTIGDPNDVLLVGMGGERRRGRRR